MLVSTLQRFLCRRGEIFQRPRVWAAGQQLESAVVLGPAMTQNPAVSGSKRSGLFSLSRPPIISCCGFLECTTTADCSFRFCLPVDLLVSV